MWYNGDMKHNRLVLIISIAGLAALLVMLNFTSPTDIGPFGVLLFFTTAYLVCFGVIALLMQSFLRLAFKKEIFRSKDYLYSAVLAFAPIMLLMTCSFGVTNLWTVGLICLFICLAEFLVAKRI